MNNSCYRSYTNKEKVSRVVRKSEYEESTSENSSSQKPMDDLLSNVHKEPRQLDYRCVICNSVSRDHDSNVSKMYEPKRAENFVSIIRFYNDEISARCVHVENSNDILTGEIYFHKNCLTKLERKYVRDSKVDEVIDLSTLHKISFDDSQSTCDESFINSQSTSYDESVYNSQLTFNEESFNSSQSQIGNESVTCTFF